MTRYELQALTLVPTQIISAATCKPIISIVQDTLVGAYLLTSKVNTIDRKLFNNMMMKNVIFNMAKYALKDAKTYNGHQAYSTILPDFSFQDMNVEIINGIFQKGILNKKLLGGTAGGLIQNIYNIYGDKEAQRFLDATQSVITRWLEIQSFSIGYGDCSATKKIQSNIDNLIDTTIDEANALTKKAQLGLYNPKIDESLLSASMEMDMTNILANIGIKIEKILQDDVSNENRFKVAVESGSKGSYVNLRQVMGSVGQQIVWSSRINNGFTERTLPHFFKTDYGPMAKGYIKNSFFRGMTPTEFFFHMMAGRTGTIDTAIKTASTGYISRRLMKAMEDIKVEYDYTVRNSFGNIVQFIYGEDSFDPVKLELNILKIIQYSDIDMKQEFQFDEIQDKKYWQKLILPTVVEEFMKEKDYVEKLNAEFKALSEIRNDLRYKYMKNLDVITNNVCYLPINFYRLLPIIKNKFEITDVNIPNLSPTYIIAEVEKLIMKCRRYVTQEIGLPYLEIMIRMYLSSKQILTVFRLNKVAFDFLTMTIHNKVLSAFAQYGEMVGAIAAQSIGEPSTQLTLNSVDWETRVLIKEKMIDGTVKMHDVQIGQFIDNIIDNSPKDIEGLIENHPNDTVLRWTKDTNNYEIMSCDEDGRIMWDNIDAVTRHPVINEDGSDTLVKITTHNGRIVTATKGISFLTRVDNKIVPTRGDSLKIGDRLPVSMNFPISKEESLKYLDMTRYFPKTEFIYGSELKKAFECSDKERFWYKKNVNKVFTLPYSRGDAIIDVKNGGCNKVYLDGCIYPGKASGSVTSIIPEKFPLDELFGFFFGAYLAEGCCTKTFICISNNNETFRNKIYKFLDKYKIGHHTVVCKDKIKVGWTSTDIKVHSTMMAKLMSESSGNSSADKFVPDFAYHADIEFVRGLLSGYFSGDGSVSAKLTSIDATSVSENLIDGIMVLLSRFGIFSKKSVPKKVLTNNRGSKNILQAYVVTIMRDNMIKFAEEIPLEIPMKQERLNKIIEKYHGQSIHSRFDIIPGIKTSQINGEMKRSEIEELLENDKIVELNDKQILMETIASPMYYDKIVKIEEVKPSKKWVYDFTTRYTRNFSLRSSVKLHDTFHQAGNKANVTEGVPRLSEIISVSKDILKPIMNIYLKDDYSESMEKANTLASQIEYTKIGDLVVETDILYEAQKVSSIDEDIEFIKTYYEFNEMFDLDIKDVENLSNWVLRIIFDKELMMNKDITMSEVQTAIIQNVTAEDSVQCIFSDDNSGDLVMRIRIRNNLENDNYMIFLDEFEKSVRNITLRGVPGIQKIFPAEANQVKYNPDSTYTNKKVWKLISEGSNLIDIMKNDFVDNTITDTNNISEILEILGLEAARNAIIQETNAVFNSVKINYRHIALLADCMCYRGTIMKIHRFGINRSTEYGPISKMTFEEVNDVLISASLFSSKDSMKGTSANIMMGQMVKAGTNAFNLLLDEELLTNTVIKDDTPDDNEDVTLDVNQVENDIEQMYEGYDEDLAVQDGDFEFGYHLDDTEEYDLGDQPHVIPSLSKESLSVAEKLVNEIPTKTKKIKVINTQVDDDDIVTDVEPYEETDELVVEPEKTTETDVKKPIVALKSALKKIKVVKKNKDKDVDETPKSKQSKKKTVKIVDE